MTNEQLRLDNTTVVVPTFERVVEVNDSSVVQRLSYSPKRRVLRVLFASGSVFEYEEVWPADFADLASAYSVGQVFNERIRDRFPACRIAESVEKRIPATKKARNSVHRREDHV